MVNKWLQKWLGINHELNEQRYKVIELGLKEINQKYVVADLEIKEINAKLRDLTKGIEYLAGINTKLAEATDKLAQQVKLQSDEISAIKKQLDSKAKEPTSKPKK